MEKMPLLTPGGFPGAARLVGIAKGKLSPSRKDGLGASRFGEPVSPCVLTGIRAQRNPACSMLGVGLRRWGFTSQILICVKLIIIPGLSSLNQRDADVCGCDPHCPARAKQPMD